MGELVNLVGLVQIHRNLIFNRMDTICDLSTFLDRNILLFDQNDRQTDAILKNSYSLLVNKKGLKRTKQIIAAFDLFCL